MHEEALADSYHERADELCNGVAGGLKVRVCYRAEALKELVPHCFGVTHNVRYCKPCL